MGGGVFGYMRREETQKKSELQMGIEPMITCETLYHGATGAHMANEVTILCYETRTTSLSHLNNISILLLKTFKSDKTLLRSYKRLAFVI